MAMILVALFLLRTAAVAPVQPAALTERDRSTDCFGRCGVLCGDEEITGDFYTPECEAHDACVRSLLRGGASQLSAHLRCGEQAIDAAGSWLKAEGDARALRK